MPPTKLVDAEATHHFHCLLAMLPAMLSGERYSLPVLLAIALGLAVFTTLLFAYGLKLQIPITPDIPGLKLPRIG